MDIISIAQVIVSIILITLILLQNSTAGVGGAFGGADTAGAASTRRGAEKQLLNLTVIFAILFAGLSLAALFF